jgi:hypothetical protein
MLDEAQESTGSDAVNVGTIGRRGHLPHAIAYLTRLQKLLPGIDR